MNISSYALMAFAALFWSLNIIIGKLLGGTIPPSTLSFLRWFFPLLLFLPLGWKDIKANISAYRKHWRLLLLLGMSGYGLNSILLYASVRYSSAINTSFINSFNPVLIALTGFLLYRFPVSATQVVGFLVSLVGVVWIIFQGNLSLVMSMHLNIGDLFMVGSIVVWSFHTILYKRHLTVLPAKSVFAVMMLAGVVSSVPLMIAENLLGGVSWIGRLGFQHVVGILCLNIFPSILAFRFWNKALGTVSANKVAIFLYLIPVFTVLISLLFLGDHLMAYQAIGGALIFAGVLLVANSRSERREEEGLRSK
ncbi:MAG: DMT family transporter [Treponema sp.]|nr:DMT family transporter [Treponema sp.]